MASNLVLPASSEKKLQDHILKFVDNPLGFVRFAFPWGEEGHLQEHTGPDVWQEVFLKQLGCEVRKPGTDPIRFACASGHGVGKALYCKEKVFTPEGSTTIGELQEGDTIIGGDGRPCKVLGVYPQGVRPLYRVTFSDGAFVLADADHLWSVTTQDDRSVKRKGIRTLTTEVMRSTLFRRYQIPMTAPVEFTERAHVIHPYLLGYILGNGSLCTPSAVKVSCHDPEVYDRVQTLLPQGYRLAGRAENYQHISSECYGNSGNVLWREIVRLGLAGAKSPDKFIPDEYLYDSVDNRTELLRGMMDADGCCVNANERGRPNHYRVVYNTSSTRLRDGFVFLVQSFGGTCTYHADTRRNDIAIQHGDTICRGAARYDNYQLSPNFPVGLVPFYLARKADVYKLYDGTNHRGPIRTIRQIDLVSEGEAVCIRVNELNQRFLTSQFVVTHNSTLIAWIILWFLSTRPHALIRVTANTKEQLLKTTFRELAVWLNMAIHKHWFVYTATKLYHQAHPETWFAHAIPWSKENSEAFAGLHSTHVMILFDEASAIDEAIWTVTNGALTTNKAIWLVYGNPTKNTGSFRECFGSQQHRWITTRVDSRTAKMTNKQLIQNWIDDYGEDSDFVRIRVKGEFPRAGSTQFIPSDLVEKAMRNKVVLDGQETKVLSVDVARFGDDSTVLLERHGSKVLPLTKYRGLDTMQVAALVAERIEQMQPDCTFVDGTGLGAGVVDRLRSLNYRVIDVQAGSKPDDPEKFQNKRSEMWGRMREWLRGDVELPNDDELKTGLTNLEYGYSSKMAIQLEKKDDMKKRGLASPDEADALAYSFAEPVRAHRQILLPPGLVRGAGPDGSARRFGPGRRDLDWRVV